MCVCVCVCVCVCRVYSASQWGAENTMRAVYAIAQPCAHRASAVVSTQAHRHMHVCLHVCAHARPPVVGVCLCAQVVKDHSRGHKEPLQGLAIM